MRLKKGFTLAEILIVLMVIGVIATMTIPSLMKGVTEAQFKTAYKKAYNTIVNLCAMERIAGLLPSGTGTSESWKLFSSLNTNLSVREYANPGINGRETYTATQFKTGLTITDGVRKTTYGNAGDAVEVTNDNISEQSASPWIITEDNLAYAVIPPTGGTCGTKADINAATSTAGAAQASCQVVIVDVNGLSKGPNAFDSQLLKLEDSQMLNTLVGDQYYIFVGSDGATAGPKKFTVSGRIVSDIK